MAELLIKNGRLVLPEGPRLADVLARDGLIAEIGLGLHAELGAEVYDASGCTVFPGFIDAHTHLDMETAAGPTADNFDSGTRGALAGGTTTLIDFATQDRGSTLGDALKAWHAKADGKAWCDYGFHMAVTDWQAAVHDEVDAMFEAGISSFKVYMAYDNLRLRDADIYSLMKAVRRGGGIVSCHCENGDLVNELIVKHKAEGHLEIKYHPLSRPSYLEGEAVKRFLTIAKTADAPAYIVHVSSGAGLAEALRAREGGQLVALETCPQYLKLTDAVYAQKAEEAAKFVCSPPIRGQADQDSLWAAIDKLDIIATDHCSFQSKGQKQLGWDDFSKVPNGLAGIENRPSLLYTYGVKQGRMDECRMAELLAEAPARIFGMYPQKGVIAPGSDADLVVWQEADRVITAAHMQQNVDHSPYEGIHISGLPKAVFLRGRKVFLDGEMAGAPRGHYVKRGPADLSMVKK